MVFDNLYFNTGIIVLLAYLIGAFPTGYLLVKFRKGIDIRTVGSGSTGATNVKRVLGKKDYFTVMIVDALKGALPVLAAKYLEIKFGLFAEYSILPVLVSTALIIGHSKPVYLGFKGGKSVATGVGSIVGLCWPVGFITIALWCAITWFSKIVSISSIITILMTPVLMYLMKQPTSYIAYCTIGALYIVYLHRSNIKRLIHGKENKIRD